MVVNFTPLQPMLGIVHGDLRLVCGCSGHGNYFMKLPTNSYCADAASRGTLELGWVLQLRTDYLYVLHASAYGWPENKFNKLTCWKGCIDDGTTLKVTELFSKAILLPMLVYGGCMAVCSILYTCQEWMWLKKTNPLIWRSTYLFIFSVFYLAFTWN